MSADSFGDELVRWGTIAGGIFGILSLFLFAWTKLGVYKIYRWFTKHIEADRRQERIQDITKILGEEFSTIQSSIDEKLDKINERIDNHMNEEEVALATNADSSRRLADAQESLAEQFSNFNNSNSREHGDYDSRLARLEKLLEA